MKEKIKEIVEIYSKLTEKECYQVEYLDETPGILDDKIGGVPYLPVGEDYPKDNEGTPMALLFQVNLKNIQLENFPNKGILEIFICSNEDTIDLFSFDYENHSAIRYFEEGLEYQKDIECVKNLFIETPIKIQPKKTTIVQPYNMSDNSTVNMLLDIVEEVCNVKLNFPMEIETKTGIDYYELMDEIHKITTYGTTIGGYPIFINEPDVSYDENTDECILYLDSDFGKNICFGPDGGSFFATVTYEDLKNCDFSNFYCNFNDC